MPKRQDAHEQFCMGYIARNVTTPKERAGVNCGLGDAAHLVDAMTKDLVEGMRPSKRKSEIEALGKTFGDAIWAFRERVMGMPMPDAQGNGGDGHG